MRSRIITVIALAILAAGCGTGYQSNNQGRTDGEVAQPYGNTTVSNKITSIKGYSPTADDVSRYNNDIYAFLQANVPNFSRFSRALVMIDGVEAESISGVALSDVRLISVLDSSNAVILGTIAHGGAIVIQTK
ncbi:MAG: hypothetical protein K6E37_08025 [Bacteroidales bacterium]|nr:hypothetical protein [Bacteroidales bacterium]